MTTYKYKGQSLSGARVSGVVRAYDEFEAVAKLRDTCAFITKIEPVKERGNALDKPIGFRLKDKELALLCSQFSIILTSGLSVMRCVEMVASQTRNKYTRRMLEKVAEEVGAGAIPSRRALRATPLICPPRSSRPCARARSPARSRCASTACTATTNAPPGPVRRSSAQ